MISIHDAKRPDVCGTPLLLFECQIGSGAVQRWSTHTIAFDGFGYESRILKHNLLEMRAASEGGIDASSRVTVTLANADSVLSQIARNPGWKGAKLIVRFLFWDLKNDEPASESVVIFRGICNPPDEITETTIRLSFSSRMNLQRILLPQIRIQRRCPWMFPTTAAQRLVAIDGGPAGVFSPFYRCGYSADLPGGSGNLNGGQPYTSCDYSRSNCIERGMFDQDLSGKNNRRFGGIEFVPPTIHVKSYGEKSTHSSGATDNEAKYNDFVPMVYGTAWYRPPVVFARGDGNLTHMEVLLGAGEISRVLKVVVNGHELPPGTNANPQSGATGWFNIVSHGTRDGSFNLDFNSSSGEPAGDPYGSMGVLSVVVPNRISDGTPLPRVDVLLEGLKVEVFDAAGTGVGTVYANNPAWILLDLLRRSGWTLSEIDVLSFVATAAYCDEQIETSDLHGNAQSVARFQCNLVVRNRRSAADLIRGVRNGAGLYLTYGNQGLLTLRPESAIAIQQPDKPACSNSDEMLNGGWPVYEFGDGSDAAGDILRRENGEPSIRVWSRSTAESPNRYSIEFQDEFNEFQQDSLSVVDMPDAVATGEEIAASLLALGLPNFNQAGRILRLHLDKSLRGNTYVDFETGTRGIGIAPGDLITLTYAKEGFSRQPFRVLRVAPGLNYSSIAITAQIHDDSWYTANAEGSGLMGGGRETSIQTNLPRPLCGTEIDESGDTQFAIDERAVEGHDGSYEVDIAVEYAVPTSTNIGATGTPLVSLAPNVVSSGGTLQSGSTYFYAVTAVTDEVESALSFLVRASIPQGTATNTVTLQKLSFGPGASGFNVYRGTNPVQLLRIASNEQISATFTDTGLPPQPITPPDPNFHHANFYWRLELLPEVPVETHTPNSLGSSQIALNPNEYRGKVVRITRGKGKGQERIVGSNTETTIVIAGNWVIEPDNTSSFVVAESTWNFGAQCETSPAVFRIPNRVNAGVHVSGRAANVYDRECSAEVSPLTRHTIGGAAADQDVPDMPLFAMRALGSGLLEVGSIGFEDLQNTRSLTAANLTLHYVDEIGPTAAPILAADVDSEVTDIVLSTSGPGTLGSILQIGDELLIVDAVAENGSRYTVQRGSCGSQAAPHSASDPVLHLNRKVQVLPFTPGFFGTPASGSYSQVLTCPDVRIAAAEMSATNARGTSQARWISYTSTADFGLRTLSGGQMVFQVDGPLAIQSNAAPPIVMDTSHAVRDVFAIVSEMPEGGPIEAILSVEGTTWCTVTIAAGETTSDVVYGRSLPALTGGKKITIDVTSTGLTIPGAGLSVAIRF